MPETFDGLVSIQTGGATTMTLNGSSADARFGGAGRDGDIQLTTSAGTTTISLDGAGANLTLGANGSDGDVYVRNTSGSNAIWLNGASASVYVGGGGTDGEVYVRNTSGQSVITMDGGNGNVYIGGNGQDGDVYVRNSAGQTTVSIDGTGAGMTLGGGGADGDIVMRNSAGQTTVHMDGQGGNFWIGGNGADGDIILRATDGTDAITLDAQGANIWLGGNGRDGDIVLFPASATTHSNLNHASIHLNGDSGDIILRNADCAEEFTVENSVDAAPGAVMVICNDGLLRPCAAAYDTRAVGVVSGAGRYKPGIVLDRQDDRADRSPIAMMGKVCVMVTDQNGPIEIGDLLTTSDTPGHAMKAGSPERSFGAVIGKAMERHDAGAGMIAMLIALQ